MDDRIFSGGIVIAVLALLLALMYLGWRRRQRSQSDLPRPLAVPDRAGNELLSIDALYVASTLADEPLNRVAVAGLGYRARATVAVFDGGIVLEIAGEPDAFLPASDLVGVDRSTWTIDRVVESRGLVRLSWLLGDTAIDSFFRVTEPADPSALIGAIETIIQTPAGVGNEEN